MQPLEEQLSHEKILEAIKQMSLAELEQFVGQVIAIQAERRIFRKLNSGY